MDTKTFNKTYQIKFRNMLKDMYSPCILHDEIRFIPRIQGYLKKLNMQLSYDLVFAILSI